MKNATESGANPECGRAGPGGAVRPVSSPGLDSGAVRRACEGDPEATGLVFSALTPMVVGMADARLGILRRYYEPVDLAQEVLLRLLPRLPEFQIRGETCRGPLLACCATMLQNILMNLYTKHYRDRSPAASLNSSGPTGETSLDPADSRTGVITGLVRNENARAVVQAMQDLGLDPKHRELLFLRGVEGLKYRTISESLGIPENSLRVFYSRILDQIRKRLPGAGFDEFPEA